MSAPPASRPPIQMNSTQSRTGTVAARVAALNAATTQDLRQSKFSCFKSQNEGEVVVEDQKPAAVEPMKSGVLEHITENLCESESSSSGSSESSVTPIDLANSSESTIHSEVDGEQMALDASETKPSPIAPLQSALDSFLSNIALETGKLSFVMDNARARPPDCDIHSLTCTTMSTMSATDTDTITTASSVRRYSPKKFNATSPVARQITVQRATQSLRFDEAQEERVSNAPIPPQRRRSMEVTPVFDPPINVIETRNRIPESRTLPP